MLLINFFKKASVIISAQNRYFLMLFLSPKENDDFRESKSTESIEFIESLRRLESLNKNKR